MYPALPGSDYYEDSAPSWRQQSTAGLPATRRRGGQHQDGSHVHHQPIGEGGGQLCPGSIAMSTPQAFLMASWSADAGRRRSRPPWWTCAANRPISTRLEPAERLRGFHTGSLSFHLLALLAGPGPSGSADPSRRCRGCSRLAPRLQGLAVPQLHRPAATDRRRSPFISARLYGASWRTHPALHVFMPLVRVVLSSRSTRGSGFWCPGSGSARWRSLVAGTSRSRRR